MLKLVSTSALALAGLALTSGGAMAAAPSNTCAKATSQADLNMCAGEDAKKADAQLNQAYGQVMARLSANGKTRLRDAQRAWLLFRDKECTFESNGSDGGSISPMIALNCMTALTAARAKDVAAFRTCQEGDTSCPT